MIWFTSDTHFGHENVLKFTDRPWETIWQMNSAIVDSINGKVAKPSAEVKEGDVIEIRFGEKLARLRVLSVAETVRKNEASAMYEMLEGEEM